MRILATMAIITAIDEGIILDNNKLNPISVTPKLLGEKNNNVEMTPTRTHEFIK